VLAASLAGKDCYYHVTLPAMEPNCSYEIREVRIMNMGGSTPEKHLELHALAVSMQVVDWRTGFEKEVVFD
jgi:hypothetical protein